MMERADIVVIGGGVTGLSSAFWLTRAGMDVLVVEKGIVGWEASGRNGGSVGPRGDDPSVVPLATESCRLWPTMDQELGYPTEFVGKGRVAVALDEDRMAALTRTTHRWSALGIPIRLVDVQEMREFLPCVSPKALGGYFSPRGGHANPQRTVQAFAWATLDGGGRIWQETVVTAIKVSKGKVSAVETTRGPVATETVVSCAGPQSALIGRMVGIEIPIVPARVEIIATVPLPPIFQVAVGGNGLYGRQTLRGNLIFGGGPHEWTEVCLDREPNKPNTPLIRNIARRLAVLFPSLADTPILRSWAGVVEEAPDYCPIIERLQSHEGFVMAMVSGHGFGLCPATGKAISELVTEGKSSIDIGALGLSRFADLDPSWRESRKWTVGEYNT
jgi:sarcosine oxidase subunit beta